MKNVRVILTKKESDARLKEMPKLKLEPKKGDANVYLNDEVTFQEIIGFGGAITEASAYNLSKMSKKNYDEVIEKYYDKEKGLGYTLGRIHINSSDFALENYTYVEENDKELKTFDISRERKWVLPVIKDAGKQAKESIKLLASPWSPCPWMKDNKEMNHGGHLLPEFYQTWANYYVKFVEEMRKEGADIFAITVQNEPAAVQTWDSCIYSAEEEAAFVKNYLGPTFDKSGLLKDTKILIWDHNRDIMVQRVVPSYIDSEASKYIWGTAFHWYVSEAFENVGKVHDLFPSKHLLFTEGCIEGGVHLGAHHTGERYARNMIGDFNNWCEGYIEWNIVLDEKGGPNHVGNYCDAPIIYDTKNDKLIYNSTYYYIGHFSKYIKPKAKRIAVANISKLKVLACKNVNGEIVVVVLNETDKDEQLVLDLKGEKLVKTIDAHSIETLIIE